MTNSFDPFLFESFPHHYSRESDAAVHATASGKGGKARVEWNGANFWDDNQVQTLMSNCHIVNSQWVPCPSGGQPALVDPGRSLGRELGCCQ